MSFHPGYTFPDADLVLVSKEGTKFQVYSLFLKHASGFFRSMLEIPRDVNEGPKDPIHMDESQEIIKALLDVCYPDRRISASDITSFDFLRDLAIIFVEKYDVPAGVAIVRDFFFDPRISASPILLYGLARRFSWNEEEAVASKATLEIDLRTAESRLKLSILNGRDVVDLLALHDVRKQTMLFDLNASGTRIDCTIFNGPAPKANRLSDYTCNNCKKYSLLANPLLWTAFCFCISDELDRRPSGAGLKTLKFWDVDFFVQFRKAWNCTCFDRKLKSAQESLLDMLEALPKTTAELLRSPKLKK